MNICFSDTYLNTKTLSELKTPIPRSKPFPTASGSFWAMANPKPLSGRTDASISLASITWKWKASHEADLEEIFSFYFRLFAFFLVCLFCFS